MVTLDLAQIPVRDANEALRTAASRGEDIEIVNPDARHHLGVGLVAPVTVKIRGSAGYFCAGLSHGARFEIESNVGWGVGDSLYAGSVVVGGNASAIAGVALRGGEIVIKGNTGSRAGQVMKAGTLLCCGNASFLAGYMMYGGRIIILGDSGERVGEDMSGGAIYVGGKVQSFGADAKLGEMTPEEDADIRAFLNKYGIAFEGEFQKIVNAGTKLRYGVNEPIARPLPYTVAEGTYWNAKVAEDIHAKAMIGRYRIRGYGAAKTVPHFNDIALKIDPERIQAASDALASVNLKTKLGDRSGAKPLELSMPVLIAPMSYGALSKSTKIALARASKLAGVVENTGEGGMLPEQRAEAGQLIYQCLSGRLGWNIHDMLKADCLEIYISQGAKPGLGGQLMAKKVTKELAAVRGIPEGIDLRSPSRHPDIMGADDLVIKVEEFREATGYKKPISIKMGAGRVRDDIKIAYKDGFDFVQLDGMQGSTGAASTEVLENMGIPTLAAIQEALDGLKEIDAGGDMPIVFMGGVKDGVDAVKALALGASAVAMGTAALIAGGCISCMQCHVGNCVVGIATQDPEHEERYKIDVQAKAIARYFEAVRWQIATLTKALGYTDFRQLSRKDLVALTPEAAAITGLPYDPDYIPVEHLLTEVA
ncbi:glutamate synthase domain-containing protein 2/formylmethanofuran dehydrogenase subunit C [Rhodoblastus acidophilus]|uniref:glutamate synthase-related protein n=1 Tax=Rhodoblastus acidophilus TaxID=1074 RepID=UPI0022248338|nr:glutamate synthase-related protein [Rhodoblastus acidophilus]MCW2315620.1 glutamate synthase domain-containing protein 2/formylmethanofuran dehydrogenase subunit C [Rhodoblastus acidophilus]